MRDVRSASHLLATAACQISSVHSNSRVQDDNERKTLVMHLLWEARWFPMRPTEGGSGYLPRKKEEVGFHSVTLQNLTSVSWAIMQLYAE